MKRINATFSDEMAEKIKQYKAQEGVATFAESVNQLVELGLQKKVVNVSTTSDFSYEFLTKTNQVLTEILTMKRLLANNSDWIMESRLLNRHLVVNMPNQPEEKGIEILKNFKERAQDFVKKIVPGHVSVLSNTHLK